MKANFDEISIQYWLDNRKYIQAKSYSCFHNGYVYGDNMQFDKINFVFVADDNEIIIDGESPRKTYIKFVEAACNQSIEIINGFLTAKADKFKIFPEIVVHDFTSRQKNSTRIQDENSAIIISDKKYYVANNLKICEFFNAAATALTEEYRKKWYIRIICNDEHRNTPLKAVDELQPTETKSYSGFKLLIDDEDIPAERKPATKQTRKSYKTDYLALNEKKKSIGDLGEYIVIEFEKKKLCNVGLGKLAKQIEHTSQEVGDNEGYDIKSFTEQGELLYIEVKSTEQDHDGGFYISQNEITVANKMQQQKKNYRIYRLYNINKRKGEAHLKIYEPPFDTGRYIMKVTSWYIESEI
ncbi:MAG: DUF3883 domain-containing protein [Enterocloster citroniae]|nr:DUF3883 domain-containing protein [Enterocloster citroniae]